MGKILAVCFFFCRVYIQVKLPNVEISFFPIIRTALKGKNLLPLGANSFLKEKSHL